MRRGAGGEWSWRESILRARQLCGRRVLGGVLASSLRCRARTCGGRLEHSTRSAANWRCRFRLILILRPDLRPLVSRYSWGVHYKAGKGKWDDGALVPLGEYDADRAHRVPSRPCPWDEQRKFFLSFFSEARERVFRFDATRCPVCGDSERGISVHHAVNINMYSNPS